MKSQQAAAPPAEELNPSLEQQKEFMATPASSPLKSQKEEEEESRQALFLQLKPLLLQMMQVKGQQQKQLQMMMMRQQQQQNPTSPSSSSSFSILPLLHILKSKFLEPALKLSPTVGEKDSLHTSTPPQPSSNNTSSRYLTQIIHLVEFIAYPLISMLDDHFPNQSQTSPGFQQRRTVTGGGGGLDNELEGLLDSIYLLLSITLKFPPPPPSLLNLTASPSPAPPPSLSMTRQILIKLPLLVSDLTKTSSSGSSNLSSTSSSSSEEEKKLWISKCFLMLFQVLSRNLQVGVEGGGGGGGVDLCGGEFQPVLAHDISVLLEFLGVSSRDSSSSTISSSTSASFSQLRISSLEALKGLLLCLSFGKDSPGDRIAQFLPGLISTLSRLLQKSGLKENQRVLCGTFECMGMAIVGCLGNVVCTDFLRGSVGFTLQPLVEEKNSSSPQPPVLASNLQGSSTEPQEKHQKESSRLLKRDERWFNSTVKHISSLLPPLLQEFKTHPQPSVRLAITKLAHLLLDQCSETLKSSMRSFSQTLVYATSDRDLSISEYCKEFMGGSNHGGEIVPTFKFSSPVSLVCFETNLLEGLSTLLMGMPRVMVPTANERSKIECLSMTLSHLRALPRLGSLNILEGNWIPLLKGLFSLLEPRLDNVRMVQDTQAVGSDVGVVSGSSLGIDISFPRKNFKSFNDSDTFEVVQGIIKELVEISGDELVTRLVDTLKVKSQEGQVKSSNHYQCLILLNEVLRVPNVKVGNDLIETILNAYLELDLNAIASNRKDQELLRLVESLAIGSSFIKKAKASDATSTPSDPEERRINSIANSNALLLNTCLVLEGLALGASHLSNDNLSYLMMDGLYFMLEKLGNPNYFVSSSALACLTQISSYPSSSSSGSVSTLIYNNVDYLVDSISHKLRYVTKYPLSPRVLIAAIRTAGPAIIGPLLSDVLDQVLDILEEVGSGGFINGVGRTVGEDSEYSIVGELVLVLKELMNVLGVEERRIEVADIQTITSNQEEEKEEDEGILKCSPEMRAFIKAELKFNKEKKEFDSQEPTATAEKFFSDLHSKEPKLSEEGEAEDPSKPAFSAEMKALEDAATPPPLTPLQSQALTILTRSLIHLHSDSPLIRSHIIQIWEIGVPILSKQPTHLLPLVHKLWPVLIRRLSEGFKSSVVGGSSSALNILTLSSSLIKDTNAQNRRKGSWYIVQHSLKLLRVLGDNCGAFVRARVAKDVFPSLLSMLEEIEGETSRIFLKKRKGVRGGGVNINSDLSNRVTYMEGGLMMMSTEMKLLLETLETLEVLAFSLGGLEPLHGQRLSVILVGLLNSYLFDNSSPGVAHGGVQKAALKVLMRLSMPETPGGFRDWIWVLIYHGTAGTGFLNGGEGGGGRKDLKAFTVVKGYDKKAPVGGREAGHLLLADGSISSSVSSLIEVLI